MWPFRRRERALPELVAMAADDALGTLAWTEDVREAPLGAGGRTARVHIGGQRGSGGVELRWGNGRAEP